MVLLGAEIKSLREGAVNLSDAYVRVEQNQALLLSCHISPYKYGHDKGYSPERSRKLLLHAHEIEKLRGATEKKGLTVVPTKMYFKNGRAKIEIALARGKDRGDKRQDVKEREAKREISRALKGR
jgi:SsrA-binding protein